MSELEHIDLWPGTPEWSQRLAAIITRRHDDALTGGDTRPEGMRLSTACPIRRVKALWEPRLRFKLHPRLACRGFAAEDLAEAAGILDDCELQVRLPWGPGGVFSSAWDGVHRDGQRKSLKSVSKDDAKAKPSRDNQRQDARMLVAEGAAVGSTVETWMLNMSYLEAVGPVVYTLTEEDAVEAAANVGGSLHAWTLAADHFEKGQQPAWWDDEEQWVDLFGIECCCGGCIQRVALDGNAAIEARITRYHAACQRERDAKEEKEDLRDALVSAAGDLLHGSDVRKVMAHTRPYTIAQTKAGQWRITERKEEVVA